MSGSDLTSKLEGIWSRLPGVLRWMVFGLSLFLFIEIFGSLADGDQLGWPALIALVAVLSAMTFAAIMMLDLQRRDPKEVVADAELANKHSRLIFWLCVAGALISLVSIWFAVRLLVPGDTEYHFKLSFFAGGMIAAVLVAPLVGIVMAWGIGWFMAPSWITSDYTLMVAADAHDILKNRADIERAPEFQHGIGRAERINSSHPAQYRLYPDGIVARLVRFGQKVTVIAYEPPRHLVLDTCSDGGDY